MGLRKGEKIERLALIEVMSAEPEPLSAVTLDDVILEGFPGWSVDRFVDFFCKHNGVDPLTIVNRIEFRYVGYLATEEMLSLRRLPGRDAEVGELVFLSTELCGEWACTKPFCVSARTLARWAEMEDMDGCRHNYLAAVDYYRRAYNLNREKMPAWRN